MSHRIIVFLIGAFIIPASILGAAAAAQTKNLPGDCAGSDAWMRTTMERYAAAEGVASSVDRLSYGGASTMDMLRVADAYAAASKEQLSSQPPGAAADVSRLLAKYLQYMSDNWNGWSKNNYVSVHNYIELRDLYQQLHDAESNLEAHCS